MLQPPPPSRPDKHHINLRSQLRDVIRQANTGPGPATLRADEKNIQIVLRLEFLVGDFLFISCRHKLRLGLIKVLESFKFQEKRVIPSTVKQIQGSLSLSPLRNRSQSATFDTTISF